MKKLLKPSLILISAIVLFLGVKLIIDYVNYSRNQGTAKQTAFKIEAQLASPTTESQLNRVLAISSEGQFSSGLKGLTSFADGDCVETGGVCTYIVPKSEVRWYENLKALVFGRTQFTCDGSDESCQWRVAASNLEKRNSFEQMSWRWKEQLCTMAQYRFEDCAGKPNTIAKSLRLEGVDGSISALKLGDRFVLATETRDGLLEESPLIDVKIKSSKDSFIKRLLGLTTTYKAWDRLDQNGVGRNYHFAGREFPEGNYEIVAVRIGDNPKFQPISLKFSVGNVSETKPNVLGDGAVKTAQAQFEFDSVNYRYIASEEVVNENPLLVLPQVNLSVDGATTVNTGSAIKLKWSNSDTESCTASGAWSGQWSGMEAKSGSKTLTVNLSPGATTPVELTYSLTCTNASGSSSSEVILSVDPTNSTNSDYKLSITKNLKSLASGPLNEYQEATAYVLQQYLDLAPGNEQIANHRTSSYELIKGVSAGSDGKCSYFAGISYVGSGVFMVRDQVAMDNITETLLGDSENIYGGFAVPVQPIISFLGNPPNSDADVVEFINIWKAFLESCNLLDASGDLVTEFTRGDSLLMCLSAACAHEFAHMQFNYHSFLLDWMSGIWDSLLDKDKNRLLSAFKLEYQKNFESNGDLFFSEFFGFIFSATGMSWEEAVRFFSGQAITYYSDSEVSYFHTDYGAFIFEKQNEQFYIALYDQDGRISHISMFTMDAFSNYIAESYERLGSKIQTDGQVLVIRLENGRYEAFTNSKLTDYLPEKTRLQVTTVDGVAVINIPAGVISYLPTGGQVKIANVNVDGITYSWFGVEGQDGVLKGIIPPPGLFKGLPAGMMIYDPVIVIENGKVYISGTLPGGKKVKLERDEDEHMRRLLKPLLPPSQSEASQGGCGAYNFAAGCGSLWSSNYNAWTGENDTGGWSCLGLASGLLFSCGSY